jgi:hypothetical protein
MAAPAVLPVAVAGLLLMSACGSCDSTVRQTTLPAVAPGSIDGVQIDQIGRRVYLADRAHKAVDVIDIRGSSPRFVKAIALGVFPNGLAFDADRDRLYSAIDGGKVALIDMNAGSRTYMQVLTRITVDKTTADLIDYSPDAHRLFVGTGNGGEVVAIDTATNQVAERYDLNSPVEQPRYDPADRMLYVTEVGTGSVIQIDPADGRLLRTYQLKSCHPAGLAVNPTRQLALVACSGSVAFLNLTTGSSSFSHDVQGGDIATYDPYADRFVIASPHGSKDSAVGVYYGDGTFLGSVAAAPNAHGAVWDNATGLVYAPAAAGLISFAPVACAPAPEWQKFALGMSVFVIPLVLVGLVLRGYARSRDRQRDEPRPKSRWRERHEFLLAERERMRALEDAILDSPDRPATN